MRDPDEINQKLWARKKLKIRRAKNEQNKMRKDYFNIKAEGVATNDVEVSDKKKEFYDNLFKKDPKEEAEKKKIYQENKKAKADKKNAEKPAEPKKAKDEKKTEVEQKEHEVTESGEPKATKPSKAIVAAEVEDDKPEPKKGFEKSLDKIKIAREAKIMDA